MEQSFRYNMNIVIEARSKFKGRDPKVLSVTLLVPLGIHRELLIMSSEILNYGMNQKRRLN